jgi:hypothetical protein
MMIRQYLAAVVAAAKLLPILPIDLPVMAARAVAVVEEQQDLEH